MDGAVRGSSHRLAKSEQHLPPPPATYTFPHYHIIMQIRIQHPVRDSMRGEENRSGKERKRVQHLSNSTKARHTEQRAAWTWLPSLEKFKTKNAISREQWMVLERQSDSGALEMT